MAGWLAGWMNACICGGEEYWCSRFGWQSIGLRRVDVEAGVPQGCVWWAMQECPPSGWMEMEMVCVCVCVCVKGCGGMTCVCVCVCGWGVADVEMRRVLRYRECIESVMMVVHGNMVMQCYVVR